jgi:hypothetical protein
MMPASRARNDPDDWPRRRVGRFAPTWARPRVSPRARLFRFSGLLFRQWFYPTWQSARLAPWRWVHEDDACPVVLLRTFSPSPRRSVRQALAGRVCAAVRRLQQPAQPKSSAAAGTSWFARRAVSPIGSTLPPRRNESSLSYAQTWAPVAGWDPAGRDFDRPRHRGRGPAGDPSLLLGVKNGGQHERHRPEH